MSEFKSKLIFNKEALPFILRAFGKSIDEQGLIIDANTGDPILTPEGEALTKENFGGIKKGSEIFLKNDLLAVMNLAEGKY